MPKKDPTDIKAFQVRLPRETWEFLKQLSIQQERPMIDIMMTCINNYRRKLKMKLTEDDTYV